jgi:predicted CXXCH cytochrome family protein
MTDRGRMFFRAALAGFLVAVPVAARGVVDSGPHDLLKQSYLSKGDAKTPQKCAFCHLPLGGGETISLDPPAASVEYFGRIGIQCYSCHDGTTMVNVNVDASQASFHPGSHPLSLGTRQLPQSLLERGDLPVQRNRLDCTTCHNPHDSGLRPFLRVSAPELCALCHQRFENVGYGAGNLSGGHPIHETMEDDAGKTTPISPRQEFLTPFPMPYPLADGARTAGVHWERGGHLRQGREGTLECITCHTVHGSETAPPREKLLTIDPVRRTADEFCEGCHRGKRGDGVTTPYFPNPGGTTAARTYHPCDDDQGNGKGRTVPVRDKIQWPLGTAPDKPILCITCHTPHYGLPSTPALRRPVIGLNFCEECHLPELMLTHHPVGQPTVVERRCLQPPPETVIGQSGFGRTSCYSCHVAHNAGLDRKEADFIPILRYSSREDDLCLVCHPADMISCLEKDKGTVSHFLGDPTLTETYQDPNPPIRTTEWSESNLLSRYGGEKGKKIICLSCHDFRGSATAKVPLPLPHFLVAKAGNECEWEEDPGVYLCTGCHGYSPATIGSGHSHPLMNASVAKLGQPPSPPASYTTNGRLNCESCHVSHGAKPAGGYYILEAVTGDNKEPKTIHPRIDYTDLCHLCHISSKY